LGAKEKNIKLLTGAGKQRLASSPMAAYGRGIGKSTPPKANYSQWAAVLGRKRKSVNILRFFAQPIAREKGLKKRKKAKGGSH